MSYANNQKSERLIKTKEDKQTALKGFRLYSLVKYNICPWLWLKAFSFSLSFFLWTFSFYRPKYYARPIRHFKVTDRGNSHNIPCWLLWQPGSQMHLTAALKPKTWSLSIKTSVDLCISNMFRQRDLLLLDTTLYFPLKYKVFVWRIFYQ